MGCIEIFLTCCGVKCIPVINRNMGCIEMAMALQDLGADFGLIETWDVLKFFKHTSVMHVSLRLIETWDVLKFYHIYRKWC